MMQNSKASEHIDISEKRATEHGLNYVALDGNIGCMVNGAGLAMATMDIIHQNGGDPANFLDVGGHADVDQIEVAFEILSEHKKVKSIFVNIFGGIMKCDTIAQGIIEATKKVKVEVPLVVRLNGTHVNEGYKLLDEFRTQHKEINMKIIKDLNEAAKEAVRIIQ